MNPIIKVAQPGWNVNTCPDWALVFNSQWPSLQIAFEKTITNQTGPITLNHNLGFPPLVEGYHTLNNINYGRTSAFTVTNNQVTYLGGVGSNEQITVRCYNIDISTEASYPPLNSPTSKQTVDLTTGIKIVKQNPTRNISSKNLNDFILNTQAQSPSVIQVATQNGAYFSQTSASAFTGPYIVYPLKTNFIPWALAAVVTSNSPLTYEFLSVNGIQVINNNMVIAFDGFTSGSLIVLRDPLIYPNSVKVVY